MRPITKRFPKRYPSRIPALLATLALGESPALAADHRDGALLQLRGIDGDLTGLYAWTSADGKKLDLVMPWAPDSGPSTRFSDAVQWVFRVASRPAANAPDGAEVVILCTFDVGQKVSCWAGDEYLTGDASGVAGLASPSGRLRVFAGLRNDPFFFNLTGFKAASERAATALKTATRDAAGCPSIDAPTRAEITGLLKTGRGGATPRDDFARQNVLALVVEVDLSLVTRGGPLVAVTASTHKRQ